VYQEQHQIEELMRNNYVGNEYLNANITYDEVNMIVKRLKNCKAVGIDKIPNEVLKNDSIIIILCQLLNLCFKTSLVPSCWLSAIINPIPKSALNDEFVPLNYRGISLLSTISKVYSAVLNHRLVTYIESLNLIGDEQTGFRKSQSCADNIFALSSIVKNRLENGIATFVAFIDFEKAFDWVDRKLLMYKLFNLRVDGKLYLAIDSLYNNTNSCIKLNSIFTEFFETISGVRQGDNLSPTLFNIYINDLITDINNLGKGVNLGNLNLNLSLMLYADDLLLLSENEKGLQDELNMLDQ
jgi:hypothetical protein